VCPGPPLVLSQAILSALFGLLRKPEVKGVTNGTVFRHAAFGAVAAGTFSLRRKQYIRGSVTGFSRMALSTIEVCVPGVIEGTLGNQRSGILGATTLMLSVPFEPAIDLDRTS